MSTFRRLARNAAVAGLAAGLSMGALAVWAGRSTQDAQAFPGGHLHIGRCALLFGSWFALAGAATLVAVLIAQLLVRLPRRG